MRQVKDHFLDQGFPMRSPAAKETIALRCSHCSFCLKFSPVVSPRPDLIPGKVWIASSLLQNERPSA
jgi:hypothetical protein